MVPPPLPDRDGENLRLLAVFHYVFAGFGVLGLGFLLLHRLIMGFAFGNSKLWEQAKEPPPFDMELFWSVFQWLYVFMAFILVLGMTANVLSAYYLQKGQNRTFSIVVAAINCLQMPFGTTLGVITLVVLLRESVVRRYAAAALENK